MTRRALLLIPVVLATVPSAGSLSASREAQDPPSSAARPAQNGFVAWDDMTESDWIYQVATRFSALEGHRVAYPTPTAELAAALEARSEASARRHLAEARLELGDRDGAVSALEQWAEAVGPDGWAEAARWGAEHLDMALAFRAAERALSGLEPEEKKRLADERVAWADAHPDSADPLALRRSRSELFPQDARALEDWLRALEKAGKLAEADAALVRAGALPAERRLLLRSDLQADHGQPRRALEILDAAIDEPTGPDLKKAFAERVDKGSPASPEQWRAGLERAFEPRFLVRLSSYFQGQGRGDAAADLLRQVERRHEARLDRRSWLLLARLWSEIDAVPEAFRARLAGSQRAGSEEQTDDLAALVTLALRAGGRPLAWGTYNDEPYRWVARVDRTPGFWTGGLSFLLTGQDWKEALAHLETESLPDRTFEAARLLASELERRAPPHRELAALRAAIMIRHVERGEGRQALELLPRLEGAAEPVSSEARRVALLAMRQVDVPVSEELRLYRLRLRSLAPDGSKPEMQTADAFSHEARYETETPGKAWARVPAEPKRETYKQVLEDAVSRMEQRDRTHRRSLDLLLGEMDRLPAAEDLWSDLAARLERWNLDDDLGPRYERAIERFKGAGWWGTAARWYARRSRAADLQRLASEIAARFRGAALFERASENVDLEIPEQPPVGSRVRLVPWADLVRLKALERFPHSPAVLREALSRLVTRSDWQADLAKRGAARIARDRVQRVVVEDALLDERIWANLFAAPEPRERFFAAAMKASDLAQRLTALESSPERTPVQDQILFEGWSRLSRFEQAAPAADRLAAAYPGNGELASRVLSLHRSLAALDPSHAVPARALVVRTTPALIDPNPLWTELGELEEERGRPEAAQEVWRKILERDARNPERISELATLLWDYGHMAEALSVVQDGRTRLGRPRFFAFETGVLREEVKDLPGAIREYLDALWPEQGDCFCSWFDHDQRALRRLSQLLARENVLRLVERRIDALKPGVRSDEEVLSALLPLATISLPDAEADFDVDDWIDLVDLPRDPVGRAERDAARDRSRAAKHKGIARVGAVLLEKTEAMVAKASDVRFLDTAEKWSAELLDPRWREDREVAFHSTLMARRAELAPAEKDRVAREVERARYLLDKGRREEGDAVWAALAPRIGRLPDGGPRMHAEAERAGYVERTRGVLAAADEWRALGSRYPWSLGLLEDRLAFLARTGRGTEGRQALESVIPRAAAGHKETLLERLAREAIDARDLPQARRAVEQLLAQATLDEPRRLGAAHLLARLSLRENAAFDLLALAKAESTKLKPERHADLYEQLARAADAEKSWAPALALWIEALNRRLERPWIRAACLSAERAGQGAALAEFFEKQRARSPRDVRWAVAVREVRLFNHDIAGAIEMAQAAVAVRPDRESLWREAADLMVRADRVKQAADYLEGFSRTRPADEHATGWRGELYARAGDGEKARLLEAAALDAYSREAPTDEKRETELGERKARAVRRLRDYGYPRLALALLAPDGDIRKAAPGPLPRSEQAELALATGSFVRLLRSQADDETFREAAALTLNDRGRPEQKEEVQTYLLGQLFPATASTPSAGAAPTAGGTQARAFPGNVAALRKWWPFVTQAGIERPVRVAIARRAIAATPGPWQAFASVPFVVAAGQQVVGETTTKDGTTVVSFASPTLGSLWVQDLVRRDAVQDLGAFLEPRWRELLVQVRGDAPLAKAVDRVTWASWLDGKPALGLWARHLAASPDRIAEIAPLFSDRTRWDRFWALAARGWDTAPLVAALPDEARTAWFQHWQTPSPRDTDPVLKARGESIERVSVALGRLIEGAPGAAKDPSVAKLRGPRSVGDVLGAAPGWVWDEFTPRKDAAGEIKEVGDDRVVGQRADAGRLPGALWGERPGEAWYVLETLARFRDGEHDAAFVPFEVPARGRELQRSRLAAELAESLGDAGLAVQWDERDSPTTADVAWLGDRLRRLLRVNEKDRASQVFAAELKRLQPTLTEAGFRQVRRLAEDTGLVDPTSLLDPAVPLHPGLLAYLYDQRGLAVAGRFQPLDIVDFRAALASRWVSRERSLAAPEVRFYLQALWAPGAARLPRAGLVRLGGLWPHAADWLERQEQDRRSDALAAVEALPDATPIEALLARPGEKPDDVSRLLRVRVALARSDETRALALVDEMLDEVNGAGALRFAPVAVSEASPPGDEGDEEPAEVEHAVATTDPIAMRLVAWLRPFRDAKRGEIVEPRLRDALRSRRAEGPVPVASWKLALELAGSAADRAALMQEIEHAWMRGDWQATDLAPLVEVIAALVPAELPRWLARWPQSFDYEAVSRRARSLVAAKDSAGAARVLAEGRRRSLWTAAEEVKAFDAWRAVVPDGARAASPAATATPATWTAALPFWKKRAAEVGADLGTHLLAHSHDVLAARAALRTTAAGPEEPLRLAGEVLQGWMAEGDHASDVTFLRLRIARGLLPTSILAAQTALGMADPQALARDLVRRRIGRSDVDAALLDFGRIGAHASNARALEATLSVMEDRKPADAQKLRAEVREVGKPVRPRSFRLDAGKPAPYRPRDLDWSVVAAIVAAEATR